MKKMILLLSVCCAFFTACNSTKKTTSATGEAALAGNWELDFISGPRIAFDGLYPNRKPTISFDIAAKRVSGNTSCNSYNGPYTIDGNNISFSQPMGVTKMMCEDIQGETIFLETLKKINRFDVVDGKTLNFIMGDIAMMRFVRK
jgi:heat shock protein HslJ